MTEANDFHSQAMAYVDQAFFARKRGNEQAAQQFFEQALANETAAIEALEERERVQPMYSVLYRSAATLALDCKRALEARMLAAKGLALDPYPEIAEELFDVLEQANFERHLALRGIVLASDEIQVSLAGREVGFGFVDQSEITARTDDLWKLMQRIAERREGSAFRESNSSRKNSYRLYASVPRAASYAVTLRLGASSSQFSMAGMEGPDAILDEFMDLMRLLNNSEHEELQRRIPDDAYFRNFMALSKKIAPDGERIRQVGFTIVRRNTLQFTALTRDKSAIAIPSDTKSPSTRSLGSREITGRLLRADAIDKPTITLIDNNGEDHLIVVPEGMMDDIVRPMWDSYVWIKGYRTDRRKKSIILEDIAPAELPT